MTETLKSTDDAAAAVQKTPNRVSLADLEERIVQKFTFSPILACTAADRSPDAPMNVETRCRLKCLTLCILVLDNGFTIVGKSAPADTKNFNAELGARFAYEDAIRQMWPLVGFEMATRVSSGACS